LSSRMACCCLGVSLSVVAGCLSILYIYRALGLADQLRVESDDGRNR
jgi:hypothetical protein